MTNNDDKLTRLSTLFENLGAVAHALSACQLEQVFPEKHTAQLEADIEYICAIANRVAQWSDDNGMIEVELEAGEQWRLGSSDNNFPSLTSLLE